MLARSGPSQGQPRGRKAATRSVVRSSAVTMAGLGRATKLTHYPSSRPKSSPPQTDPLPNASASVRHHPLAGSWPLSRRQREMISRFCVRLRRDSVV
jgi:hypothetical protein